MHAPRKHQKIEKHKVHAHCAEVLLAEKPLLTAVHPISDHTALEWHFTTEDLVVHGTTEN